MAPHSSTSAWKIPRMEKPGRLQSMGSLRVEHDWATSLSLFTFMHWGRKWQPTPVFLPGESQGRGSLVGCCLWGHTESDTTEATWRWLWLLKYAVMPLQGIFNFRYYTFQLQNFCFVPFKTFSVSCYYLSFFETSFYWFPFAHWTYLQLLI